MARTLILLCAAMTLLTGNVIAQLTQPTPAPGPDNSGPVTRAEFSRLEEKIDRLIPSDAPTGDVQKQLADIRKELHKITDWQVEDRDQLHQLARTDKDGNSYVRLDTSQEAMKKEFKGALMEVLPKEGHVTIYNRMHTDQPIAINGETYDVLGLSYRTVTVPIGEFRVKVRNQPTQVRTVNFPTAEATVEIVPSWQPYYIENVVYEW